jgi:hypothetical protein
VDALQIECFRQGKRDEAAERTDNAEYRPREELSPMRISAIDESGGVFLDFIYQNILIYDISKK